MLRDVGADGALPAWLTRLTPDEWIRQGLTELTRAEQRLQAHEREAAVPSAQIGRGS